MLGLIGDNGKENGNYNIVLGLYKGSGFRSVVLGFIQASHQAQIQKEVRVQGSTLSMQVSISSLTWPRRVHQKPGLPFHVPLET